MKKQIDFEDEFIEPPAVNRTAVAVKAKQPYVDWANSLPDVNTKKITLEELNRTSTTYLLPCFDTIPESQEFLETSKTKIFEQELYGWHIEPAAWPKDRSPRIFDKWFEIEISEMVFELVEDEELDHDNY